MKSLNHNQSLKQGTCQLFSRARDISGFDPSAFQDNGNFVIAPTVQAAGPCNSFRPTPSSAAKSLKKSASTWYGG